ncbi:hypothetical protein METBIDRAFT_76735 [Metschnikowia bicuspidata var. bicuspidata NRRL YB-4993]|uniref:NEDD8-activating enzyme E1 catalytic subunit n=1 Tax=Metschnikowia bicuspidata var. bicuspidata NRRL YB-4993 TaxID=869754 RepID=A0A1A0HIG1_9ASCO|nr:hypothetical protein METBIDRAFT_76735 [Metschnikowia bicuspidata var. bicuspidata NRRL YB-4993]OBA23786.1 hypothetical protein METBIDRAFT_76735 [Metschnikowia bicuspidata var. bicuspidata NRRL YB-4993]
MPRGLSSITPLLARAGPFNEVPLEYRFDTAQKALRTARVLVIGAGGLGCEILKNLALCGLMHIDVVDMDTVDLSNLNRQFLFRKHDVGRPKAQVAAERVRRRGGAHVTPHCCRIQDLAPDFYRQFDVVVCGLDDVEARRWINALLAGFVAADLRGLVPLVDGGSEGFRGQARVILPTLTSCFECSLDLLSPRTSYPVCTIAHTPRLPEHCVEWACQLEWPRRFPETPFDADVPEHVDRMHRMLAARAARFGIANVTRSLALGVAKHIVPAVASTNAVIAAACLNEVFKLVTSCNPVLDNYMMYLGDDAIFTYTYAHSKKATCAVCGSDARRLAAKRWWTVRDLLDELRERPEFLLRAPSVATARRSIYMALPAALRAQTAPNLARRLASLVDAGEEMVVTDLALPICMRLVVSAYTGGDAEPRGLLGP